MLQSNAEHPPLPDSRARQTDLASPLAGRRMLFAGLVLATMLVLMALLAPALAGDGLDGLMSRCSRRSSAPPLWAERRQRPYMWRWIDCRRPTPSLSG